MVDLIWGQHGSNGAMLSEIIADVDLWQLSHELRCASQVTFVSYEGLAVPLQSPFKLVFCQRCMFECVMVNFHTTFLSNMKH